MITKPKASPRSAVGPLRRERSFAFPVPRWLVILSWFHHRTQQHFSHIQADVYVIMCASNAGLRAAGDGDPLITMTPWIPYSRSAPFPAYNRHPNCQCNWYSCAVFQLRWEWNPDECFLWNTQRDMHFSWACVCSIDMQRVWVLVWAC